MADRYEYSDKKMTAPFRAMFVKLFDKPEVDEKTGRKTWSVTAILESADDAKLYRDLFNAAAKKLWGEKAAAMVKNPKFRSPFKDGGSVVTREGELYAGFEPGQVVVRMNTKQGAPGVVDRMARPVVNFAGQTMTDKANGLYEEIEANAIYSGCFMRATVVAQAYDRSDGFGVSFKLDNLQKVRDGERVGGGGRAKPENDFQPIDAADDFEEDLLG
ncbi:ssDNA-binding protein [Pannonibacter tanglangensis]|uniref:DUF2815 family protein n=1 Tax=Pannonibacter tanglangensis TaxID=2750084 RepID=A0ABW9ZC46_9HYPH|nr:ssDNA-binding protein [Pannonibacter sp. XCT-34]NBN62086.1 DUF2815 family protein [Pannonibacter sp. XCT-34]